ncbi:hypothetical protein L6452_27799 [Arctium lappa]|uniref:Uncharacterized protein n=1 Tax=Arctium lappa TaxID=4217 RepID=A0ACB8ZWN2_ARCLA|nr:hypothetical protein L6452_27799 [Arctium lappa]
MSKDLLFMGSESKPPVLFAGEYAQWKKQMTQFLNHKNKDYMKSIIDGPVVAVVTVPSQAATETSPEIPVRYVPKPYQCYNEREKELAKIDEEALIYLTMAIPNDIYNRIDSRDSAKAMWDELERQFQGTERSIQAKLNQSINAYEGFHSKKGETMIDTYNRFNHEDEVKLLNEEKKIVKDSLALLAERKKGSSSQSVSSSKSKLKKSKAFLTELTQSSSESSADEVEVHSDDDIQRFADNLAFITK